MIIRSAEFLTSAVSPAQFPPERLFEIAFTGRSNVGKSSLINLLLGRKKLAKVSGTPGKTRTINFFLINGSFRLVDLPGYGYAKVAKSETQRWDAMMDAYLSSRRDLLKVVQLVDARIAPTALDRQMYDYLRYYGLDGVVAATKADKLSKNELSRSLAVIRRELNLGTGDRLVPVSALTKTGADELLAVLEQILEDAKHA